MYAIKDHLDEQQLTKTLSNEQQKLQDELNFIYSNTEIAKLMWATLTKKQEMNLLHHLQAVARIAVKNTDPNGKGAYIVRANTDIPHDIKFSVKPDFPEVPELQQKLHLEVEKALVVVRKLFKDNPQP